MIKVILLIFCITVVCDVAILKSLVRGTLSRRLFRVQMCVLNALPLALFCFRGELLVSEEWMGTLAWMMFVIFTALLIKGILSLSLFVRWVIRLFNKRAKTQYIIKAGYALSLVTLGVMLWGNVFGRTTLKINHIELQYDNLPESFDGFKIAQFSDLHIGNFGSWHALLRETVEAINSNDVNIVVQSGDLVNMHSAELSEDVIEILSKIKSPVYAVLGNHDLSYYIGDTVRVNPHKSIAELIEKQESMGWIVLQNQRLWLHNAGDSILLGGTTFPSNHPHNGAKLDIGRSDLPSVMRGIGDSTFAVVISHTPSLFDSIYTATRLPDLMLSGHTHSMQTKVGEWSPASFIYDKYSGLYTNEQGRKLYINDGLGYVVLPFRFGANPELTIITLKRNEQK